MSAAPGSQSAMAGTLVELAAALSDLAAAEPAAAALRHRFAALGRLVERPLAIGFDRALELAAARLRRETPEAGATLSLLAQQHPAAGRLRAAAATELMLSGTPDLTRLSDLYRRELRPALLSAGIEAPSWRLLGPALVALLGRLLPAALTEQSQLRGLLPTAEERALIDQLRAAWHTPAAALVEQLGQSIVATDGAAIARVQQTIVHGDYYATPAPAAPDITLLFARYRAFVAESFGAFDFRGILQIQAATRITIDKVYIPTTASAPTGDGKPQDLHQIVGQHPLLVVLGDPGSGKSTLVRSLLLALTRGAPREQTGLEPIWLPIFFPVASFAAARAQPGRADLAPLTYLAEYYQGLSQPNYCPLFERALEQGRALVLLDGLDEVRGDRHSLARALEALAREWDARGNRFIATSRIVGYEDGPLDPGLFATVVIQPLTDEQIQAFIQRWSQAYAALAEPALPPPGDLLHELAREAAANETERRARRHARALAAAVFSEPHVTSLARNPLLLTILALIHNQGARLPDRRADLYRLCIAALAETWNRARSLSGRPVAVHLGDDLIDERFVVNLLGPLALWLHSEQAGGLVDQEELEVRIAATLTQSEGLPKRRARRLAKEFVELMRRDTGLLTERGYRRFGFMHLTFKEYLAARGLLESITVVDPDELLRRYVPDPHWRQVLRLAVAAAPQRDAQHLVLTMLGVPDPPEAPGHSALLAGECLLDAGRQRVGGRAWVAGASALLALGAVRETPIGARMAAMALLGQLGDPRRLDPGTGCAEGAGEAGLEVPDYWCGVAAGPFWHGDEQTRPRQQTLHRLELPYGFRLGRYPVTNGEFLRFVASRAYADPRWWTPAGWAFISGSGRPKSAEAEGVHLLRPAFWDVPHLARPSQPVVGVSWYEAAAYAAWLTAEGQAAGWLYPGEVLRLPTALEWERAARHSDRRSYPWGDELPTPEHASYAELGLNAPAPVGAFPAGAAACGALDMAGNVWEWTASSCEAIEDPRPLADVAPNQLPAVKGGAFSWEASALRCGASHAFPPSHRQNLLGFRLVWAAAPEGETQ